MLKEKVIEALAWQTGAKLLTQAFSFGVTILLARLLLPEDFGLVGMALVFTGFIDLINEMGIGSSIIRKQQTSKEELSSVFWFSMMVGCGLYAITFASAPLVAAFFRNNAITDIVRVLGLNLLIGALRTVPFNLLTREMRFSQRSRAEIMAALCGGCTALLLALYGFGVWSLVLNSLASGLVLTILCFWISGWRPLVIFRMSLARDLVSFGAKVMGARIQWYTYSNADFFIVGRMLGNTLLGHYTMAFNLAVMPTEKITAVVNQVMFPAFSRLQHDIERLRSAFLQTTCYISMLTFPLMVILAILAPEIIVGLLTNKWRQAVFPLRVLCLVGLLRSIDVIIPQMLVARGRADLVFKYSTVLFIVLPIAFAIGCYCGGINGVAYAWMITYPFLTTILFYFCFIELGIDSRTYIKVITPQLLATLATGVLLVICKYAFIAIDDCYSLYYLLCLSVTGMLFYICIIKYFYKNVFVNLQSILRVASNYQQ